MERKREIKRTHTHEIIDSSDTRTHTHTLTHTYPNTVLTIRQGIYVLEYGRRSES